MDINIEQFVEQYHPELLKEYWRYVNRYNVPKKGELVKSLKSGFGGPGGQVLEVLGRSTDPEFIGENYAEEYIILQRNNQTYLANVSDWWRTIEVCV